MGVKAIESKEEFDAALKSAGDKLVVVDFHATWCGPCKTISPYIEKLSGEHGDVIFLKIDVDEVDEVAAQCGIEAMPTFLFFKNGQQVEKVVGANKDKLSECVGKLK